MYRKEIIYMGLYKDGSRIGNAGFLKVEDYESESRWDLRLKNIPFNINGRFPVRIHNGKEWKEFNGISVQEGGGNWEENMVDGARKVQIQIMLPGGYFLEGRSKDAPEIPARADVRTEKKEPDVKPDLPDSPTKTEQRDAEKEMTYGMQKVKEEEQLSAAQAAESSNLAQDLPEEMGTGTGVLRSMSDEMPVNTERSKQHDILLETERDRQQDMRLETGRDREETRRSNGNRKNSGSIIISEPPRLSMAKEPAARDNFVPEHLPTYSLKEDKWEQILDSYEQIHPYSDERVYVRLEPKDFIILQSKYQHLVNNSFLLHGFYNYRYVILGKEDDYYLGVPGVFYEREKMVALMFGFEAFECPGGNARAGEFGYYLRKVEL